jgi:hypothetical protein
MATPLRAPNQTTASITLAVVPPTPTAMIGV